MSTDIPSAAAAIDMILEPTGQRAGADRGDPQTSSATVYNDGRSHVGVWECTPGGWPVVDRDATEVATIVKGRAILTDADGTERALVPGTVIVQPKGWTGRWDVIETVRKVFTIVTP